MIFFYAYVNADKDTNIDIKFIPKNCMGTFIDSANHTTGFEMLLDMCQSGDIVRLPSLKMLGSSLNDVTEKIEKLKQKRIVLETGDFGLINTAFAKYVIDSIQEIRKEETEITHVGRPKIVKPDNYDEVVNRYRRKEIKSVEAAQQLGVARSTFMRWLREEAENV